MNQTTLTIIALVAVAATAVIGFTVVQDANARCDGGSSCQSNHQRSSVRASTIDHSDVGNQAASNSVTVGRGTC